MSNEETMYMPSADQAESTTQSYHPHKALKTGWQRVVIGGISGIAVGSAATYAATHLIESDTATHGANDAAAQSAEHNMATSVTDDMSFADAFAAARAEVSEGGVFAWKGNIYSTYTAQEWDSMTPQQQMDYFAVVSGQEIPEHATTQPEQVVHHYHHTVADQPVAQTEAPHTDTQQADHFIPNNDTPSTDDSDVRIVATTDVQTLHNSDGSVAGYAQGYEIDGHAAVAIGDQQGPDVVIIDINDNEKLDAKDVIIDIESGEAATMGDVYAQMEAEGDDRQYVSEVYPQSEDRPVDTNLQEVDYGSTTDPEMMNTDMADSEIDMACDVPVIDC